ncbi:hypothetical protein Y032_0004g2117 [Ancylostoma ceylanicum]|nr:hypothetical protein Y032_0004g2117 [Ancylostoma ceylanicum]
MGNIMKRCRISGILEKDQEFYRKMKGEDQEEFENVSAVVRPAATKMRKAKLKWKTEADPLEVSARSAEKGEKSFAESYAISVIVTIQ